MGSLSFGAGSVRRRLRASGVLFGVALGFGVLFGACGSATYVPQDGGAGGGRGGTGGAGTGGAAGHAGGGQGGSEAGGASGGSLGTGGVLGASGGVPGAGGNPSGGVPGSGGGVGGKGGSAGAGVGGAIGVGGAAGAPGCPGTMRPCNGACIAATECCGGCSGNAPVCSNGACVKRSMGDGCSVDAECGTGHCADQHCCDSACDGQCESCKVAGSVGTCVPVTTPRTACGGTAACAGSCDGTTQNRKACVFPGSNTSCGAASCSNSTLTTGRTCNGAGTCGAATMMSCSFGCRTDGTAACATNCATSNEALCAGTCVDVQSSASHCGTSCQSCGGGTPKCSSGSCVQCAVPSDCSGQGMTCTAQSTCRCGASYHACGATTAPCYSDTDVTHCGSGCTDCRQANQSAACGQGDLCANTCKSPIYTLSCPAVGGKPNCSQWTWESGGPENWVLAPGSSGSAGPLTTSTAAHADGSTTSLAIPYDNGNASTSKWVEIRVLLCAGGNALNLDGKHISWSYHTSANANGSRPSGGYNYFIVYPAGDFSGPGGLFDFNSDSDGTWHQFAYDLTPPVFDQVAAIGFHLEQTEPFKGTIYIDDLAIY